MNTQAVPLVPSVAAPEMARRFGAIMAGLAALVARRFLRMPHLVGLTVLLWTRLGRAARQFERVATRAGKRRARLAPAVRVAAPRAVGLPRGRGWLVRELGWEAAGFGCQMEALLAEPGAAAVLAAMPGVGRVLRPVCRMLGIAVPVVVSDVVAPVVEVVPVPVWAGAVVVTTAEGPSHCYGLDMNC